MEIESVNLLNIILPGENIDLSAVQGQLQVDSKAFQVGAERDLNSNLAGVLVDTQMKDGSTGLALQGLSNKYYSEVEDYVIGVVKGRVQEFYIVDIGGEEDALLSFQAFEGATKKNRPNLRDGSLIFCRVAEVNRYLKIKVDCIHHKNKKQWMTGESFFGQLKEGMVSSLPINYCKDIIRGNDYVFRSFRKYLSQFETSIGVNGKVWIKTKEPKNTILILQALNHCQQFNLEQTKNYVDSISSLIQKE